MKETNQYDDIIHLPHHVSIRHTPMSAIDRAAQFSPFAALTGYEAVIEETGRLTDTQIELDEGGKAMVDEKLRRIAERIDAQPRVTVTWFQPDERKSGGAYVSTTGCVKKLDPYERILLLMDGTLIPISRIYHITEDSYETGDAGSFSCL